MPLNKFNNSQWDLMSKTLDNSDVREAASFAHRLQAEALAARFERVDQRRHQLSPGAPEWMAERNAAPVWIDAHRICLGCLQPGHWNGSKRLIHLEQINVVDLHATAIQGTCGGRNGAL